jgi:phosphate transport system permease protein
MSVTLPRSRSRRTIILERGIEWTIRLCGISAIIFVFGIFFFVFREGYSFVMREDGLSIGEFLTSDEWYPTSEYNKRYGVLALLAGTASVTFLAMLISVPVGLGTAIYVAEFSGPRTKEALKVLIELLAAIPSVVWGFIGLTIMNELIVDLFDAQVGLTVLNGGIILSLMCLPIIVSISEDALRAVPDSYREAALAMGATKWQFIRKVLLPASKNGLLAAALLGVGRAVGETMAVLMATGHSINMPDSLFDSVRTLTATIASELGETGRGTDHYQVLFVIGILLFSITFTINLVADLVVRGIRKK